MLFLCCALLVDCPLSYCWGDRAHRLVNAAAIENLPEPLRSYFRSRKRFMADHASDPDLESRQKPEERIHHYTEVEAYEQYPFPRFQAAFLRRRRGPSLTERRFGDCVWEIERFTLLMARAMRQHRWRAADHAAIFAAHYATDLTQPLHTTLNYDGQLTGQNGIHSRFETELVQALNDRWAFNPEPASAEADLRFRIFREFLDSYSFRTPLFAADRIARTGRTYPDRQYFFEFGQLAGPLAKRRLEAAISFVSSLWYTAWVRAGKPDLKGVTKTREPRASIQLRTLSPGIQPARGSANPSSRAGSSR